jgi:hypothetical protein
MHYGYCLLIIIQAIHNIIGHLKNGICDHACLSSENGDSCFCLHPERITKNISVVEWGAPEDLIHFQTWLFPSDPETVL